MPNSTLPGNTYLGNGQRTTAEIQAGLDQVAAWLNSAQAELNALTGTTFGEAAVRGVGTGATDLVEASDLDARISSLTSNIESSMFGEIICGYVSSDGTLIRQQSTGDTVVSVIKTTNSGAGNYEIVHNYTDNQYIVIVQSTLNPTYVASARALNDMGDYSRADIGFRDSTNGSQVDSQFYFMIIKFREA